ncbi:hypothetical protein BaRGS_00033840 [Batillaria attramentaria]|uniref:RING-type domain-containing protein n=1 Tax=Batillaria attramentaria TaxID=370345 RepID=A0ABD0JIY0_9CAEN
MATSSTDNSKDSSIDQHLRHNECALCLEQFKSPRILPCFHTFCLSCIKRLTLNLQPSDSFPCPSCRTAVQIPPGGADSFQVNFYIEAEMERAKCYESHAAPDCDICGNTRATHKCLDCNQMSCDNCTRIHGSFAATRDHSVLSLGSFLSGGGGISYKTDRLCGIHHEENFAFSALSVTS